MKLRPYFTMELVKKTNEKDLKIPNLQPPDWKSPYWMSLYIVVVVSPPDIGTLRVELPIYSETVI